jgi:CheY-like chemotaxis protein
MLVVEDNAINQRVMKRQLETRGCTVLTANNGLEAVEFIQQSSLNRHPGSDAKEIEICFMVFIYL